MNRQSEVISSYICVSVPPLRVLLRYRPCMSNRVVFQT